MYLNSLICLMIFIFALWTSLYIFKNERGCWADMSIAGFWLMVGATFLFTGTSLIIFKNGFKELDIAVNQYLVQTSIFAQITVGSYYAVYRITKNKKLSFLVFSIFVLSAIVGLFFDYQPGSLVLVSNTYYSAEYKINLIAWQIFVTMFAVAMFCVAVDMFRNLVYLIKKNNLFEQKYFLVDLAILFYGIVGFFDQLGSSATWVSVSMRSAIVFCVGIVFIAYSHREI